MKRFSKITIILASLAVVMMLAAGVRSTIAYFTTYAESAGERTIELKHQEDLHEEVTDTSKSIVITNRLEDSQPVYVRARAYVSDDAQQFFSYAAEAGWNYNSADGWYYFDTVLNPGDSTSELYAGFDEIPMETYLEEMKTDQTAFNIAVVYESTLALYRYNEEAGAYEAYADWSSILDHKDMVKKGEQPS